jgi:hypothetical protein
VVDPIRGAVVRREVGADDNIDQRRPLGCTWWHYTFRTKSIYIGLGLVQNTLARPRLCGVMNLF